MSVEVDDVKNGKTNTVLWIIAGKTAEGENNFVADEVIQGCLGSDATSSASTSLHPQPGAVVRHRFFSYDDDMIIISLDMMRYRSFMIQILFPRSGHNTERKLILFLKSELGMLQSAEILRPASHQSTHSLCICHSKQKYNVCSSLQKPKRDSGWIFTNWVPTKIFLKLTYETHT